MQKLEENVNKQLVYICQKSLNFTDAFKCYQQNCSWFHFTWTTPYSLLVSLMKLSKIVISGLLKIAFFSTASTGWAKKVGYYSGLLFLAHPVYFNLPHLHLAPLLG